MPLSCSTSAIFAKSTNPWQDETRRFWKAWASLPGARSPSFPKTAVISLSTSKAPGLRSARRFPTKIFVPELFHPTTNHYSMTKHRTLRDALIRKPSPSANWRGRPGQKTHHGHGGYQGNADIHPQSPLWEIPLKLLSVGTNSPFANRKRRTSISIDSAFITARFLTLQQDGHPYIKTRKPFMSNITIALARQPQLRENHAL